MKKTIYLFLTMLTCVVFITGCSFFGKLKNRFTKEDSVTTSATEQDTDKTTEDEDKEVTMNHPEDSSSEASTEDTTEDSDTGSNTVSNPREDIASNATKEYSGNGIYCGFIDSSSVEIELSDGSYCTFFVYDESVRNKLSNLDEEEQPKISFTYKAKDGQINPEMISVTVK